jgi:threonine/homoserine/homoserine lactone efflux protein
MTSYFIYSILKIGIVIYLLCVAWSVMTSLKRIADTLESKKS